MQQPGDDGIDLVGREGLRSVQGHGAMDVVIESRRIGPEAANGFDGLRRGDRPSTTDQPERSYGWAEGSINP